MVPSGNVLDFSSKVLATAWQIQRSLAGRVELADLYQAGWIGLLSAWEKFDPARSVPFATYAAFRIRGAILDSLRQQDCLSRSTRRRWRSIQAAAQRLSQAKGGTPSDQEVAEASGESLENVGWLRRFGRRAADFMQLQDQSLAPAEQAVYRGELRRLVERAHLRRQEASVLQLHYWDDLTLKRVGSLMGISESRASQIHTAALARLRKVMGAGPAGVRERRYALTA